MQPRSIIFSVIVAIVLGAFVKLFFDSQQTSVTQVDAAELEKARKKNARSSRSSSDPSSPKVEFSLPKHKAKTKTNAVVIEKEPEVRAEVRDEVPESEPEPDEEVDLKTQMNDANKLYDQGDYEGARESAIEVLSGSPDNVRMMRIVVSSSCIMGDEEPAKEYFLTLPERDQRQMTRRCERYGIKFGE